MPKGANQKMKILYLMQLFLEETDEEHPLTMQQIMTSLKKQGIQAERKSIYSDLEALRTFGMEIEKTSPVNADIISLKERSSCQS